LRETTRTYRFASQRQSVGLARQAVRRTLRALGYGDDLVDKALLVTSELAANAVVHATSSLSFTVVCVLQDEAVTVGVVDHDPRLPHRIEATDDDDCGRGLLLVEALADEWGCEEGTTGKMVFARLNVSDAPAGALTAHWGTYRVQAEILRAVLA
jgi:anti-sigma regulatory factor (Ser/Thr protein kinase)